MARTELLTPENCTLLLIDYQPQMAFAVKSIDGQTLINNATALAKAAKAFRVPPVVTSIAEKTFAGPFFPQLQSVLSDFRPIDRTSINAWDDSRVVDAVKRAGRKKLVFAGIWTDICVALPALSAINAGYEAYVVADACGSTSCEAHHTGIERMVQAGVTPLTWLQFMFELQRDFGRTETYDACMRVAQEHGGAYGLGIGYAKNFPGK